MKRDVNRQKRTIKRAARVLAVLTGACLVMLLGGCGKKEKELRDGHTMACLWRADGIAFK